MKEERGPAIPRAQDTCHRIPIMFLGPIQKLRVSQGRLPFNSVTIVTQNQ